MAQTMAGFKANFLTGLLIGAALAVLTSLVGADLLASPSAAAKVTSPAMASSSETLQPQNVNRASKSDRLHPSHKATGDSRSKMPKIPEGCDPAFSPLSKGAASNFSSRCLADLGNGQILVAQV